MKQDERELLTRAAVKARLMVDFKCELIDFLFVLVFCLLWGWMLFSLLAAVSGALLVIVLLFELPVFLWALAALAYTLCIAIRYLRLAIKDAFSLAEDVLKRVSLDELDKRMYFSPSIRNLLSHKALLTQHALYFEEHGRCVAPKRTVDHATPGEHFYLVLDQKGRALYAYHTEIYRLAA
ncbi:MAG: hypothetical protein J6D31_01925 [Clostridia bacterium]|nr:hypothetical protein [Clostridia bacterium]